MRQVVMYGPGDVRVEDREDPKIIEPTDAIIRLSATCICGTDLWPYRGAEPVDHQVMGHEYVGVVEEVGSEVRTVKVGDFVVGSFWASDNTCEICQAGYQAYCVHRVLMGTIGTQSELARIPLADGTLVATPGMPDADLIPSLMAASDVLGTGWFAAVAAEAGPGKTVAVVGDGAVGLLGILAAQQLGAERIIAFSRHADRQALAREFGATDIVEERGDEGVARVKELTGGLGAHSVIEAVGTQEAMMQAIHSTRPGGHVGFVGVSHDVAIPGDELFMAGVHIHGGPAPVRRYPARADPAHLGPQDRPRQGLRPHPAPGPGRRGLPGHGRAHRHQGPAHPLTPTSRKLMRTMPSIDRVSRTADRADRDVVRSRSPWPAPVGDAEPDNDTTARHVARSTSTPDDGPPSHQLAATPATRRTRMRIQITIGEQRFHATLDDSAAARDLVAQLPLTIDMSDHGGVEKTGPLPSPLSLDGQPDGADPDVGDLGYYAPGNDLVLYYGDQSYYPGIVILGRLDGDAAQRISDLDGPVTATVEAPVTDLPPTTGPAGLPRPREPRRADRRRLGAAPVHARRRAGRAADRRRAQHRIPHARGGAGPAAPSSPARRSTSRSPSSRRSTASSART